MAFPDKLRLALIKDCSSLASRPKLLITVTDTPQSVTQLPGGSARCVRERADHRIKSRFGLEIGVKRQWS